MSSDTKLVNKGSLLKVVLFSCASCSVITEFSNVLFHRFQDFATASEFKSISTRVGSKAVLHPDNIEHFLWSWHWTELVTKHGLMVALTSKGIQLNCSTEAVPEKHTTDTGRAMHRDCATNKYCLHQCINLFWPVDHLFKKISDGPLYHGDISWTTSLNCIAHRSMNSRACSILVLNKNNVDHQKFQVDNRWCTRTLLSIIGLYQRYRYTNVQARFVAKGVDHTARNAIVLRTVYTDHWHVDWNNLNSFSAKK